MTEPKTRAAHTADLLSVYTGKFVAMDGSLDGMTRLLQFMVNRQLFEYQLPRAADTVKPTLAEQLPWLQTVVVPDVAGLTAEQRAAVCLQWRDQLIEIHGPVHRVQQLPEGVWQDKDPIAELHEINPHIKVTAAVDTGYSIETFTDVQPGLLRNPPLDEASEDD